MTSSVLYLKESNSLSEGRPFIKHAGGTPEYQFIDIAKKTTEIVKFTILVSTVLAGLQIILAGNFEAGSSSLPMG